jgi:hypothetical protein
MKGATWTGAGGEILGFRLSGAGCATDRTTTNRASREAGTDGRSGSTRSTIEPMQMNPTTASSDLTPCRVIQASYSTHPCGRGCTHLDAQHPVKSQWKAGYFWEVWESTKNPLESSCAELL